MARKSRRNKGDNVALEMTPMIDVVFQLLIFFIVTLKQEDILSNLEALRPAPSSSSTEESEEPIQIQIGPLGFYFQGRIVKEADLRKSMSQIARINPEAMILVKCTGDSPHGYLVKALDICTSVGLRKMSVFSL